MRLLLLILILCLAACAPLVTPTTVPPTTAPTTPTVVASPTPLPPTPTVAIVASPTVAPNVPPHLIAGTALTLTTLHMLDATTGWAIGQGDSTGDHILRTGDGGQTWQDVTPPQPIENPEFSALLATAAFADANTAWVTFARPVLPAPPTPATIWRTTDGGQTWTPSPAPFGEAQAAFYQPEAFTFADAQRGWLWVHVDNGMMKDYIQVFRTTDGGQTWALTPAVTPGCYKNALVFPDVQNGWLVGDCNGVAPELFVLRTADGGDTWASVPLPSPTSDAGFLTSFDNACGATQVTFTTPQIGRLIVYCSLYSDQARSWLYRTEDGGATWVVQDLPTALGELTFTSATDAWYVSATARDPAEAEYRLYHSTDAGQTWAVVGALGWTGHINWVGDQTGLVVAEAGPARALVQTTDGGVSWAEIKPVVGP